MTVANWSDNPISYLTFRFEKSSVINIIFYVFLFLLVRRYLRMSHITYCNFSEQTFFGKVVTLTNVWADHWKSITVICIVFSGPLSMHVLTYCMSNNWIRLVWFGLASYITFSTKSYIRI